MLVDKVAVLVAPEVDNTVVVPVEDDEVDVDDPKVDSKEDVVVVAEEPVDKERDTVEVDEPAEEPVVIAELALDAVCPDVEEM